MRWMADVKLWQQRLSSSRQSRLAKRRNKAEEKSTAKNAKDIWIFRAFSNDRTFLIVLFEKVYTP